MSTVGMFLGAETANWTLAQFTDAAKLAKSLGCTVLAVKCADGSIVWYDSQGGLAAVRNACIAGGLDMIPYQYSYGDKFGALAQEIDVCKRLMQVRPQDHAAMVDMEVEWNGHADWAATWDTAIADVPGFLYLTTWANPAGQNWDGVIAAIRPCVDVWVPQEYDAALVDCESQYPAGLHMQPALNLPEAWPGPNDPVAAARTAVQRGHDGVWLWEYQLATQHPDVVRQIAAVMNGGSVPSGGAAVGVPQGWTDDGTTLTASNGVKIVHGFRDWVLNHTWDPKNWPIELEHAQSPMELGNPSIPAGTQQAFRWSVLEWTSQSNQVFEMWTGQELVATRKALGDTQSQLKTASASLASAQAQIKDLQAQIATLKAQPTTDPHAAAALKIVQALKALEGQIV